MLPHDNGVQLEKYTVTWVNIRVSLANLDRQLDHAHPQLTDRINRRTVPDSP